MKPAHLRSITLLIVLTAIGVSVLQCNRKAQPEEARDAEAHKWLNHSDTAQYVGMETCQQCHGDKHSTFMHTGMGKSFGVAEVVRSAGNFGTGPIYDRFSDLHYLPFWDADSVMHVKEFRLSGKDTVFSRIQKIDHIIGSGHHTNSHLFSVNGYLYQAPFTWYVQHGRWDMPPGYENGFNTRFSRSIGTECITCHNGYPQHVEGSLNKYSFLPKGIDCERCHGPGSIHVAQKRQGILVSANDTDFSIVNPAKLPYELQIDVCQRCHLQGNSVLKEGKTFFDFKPGMRLSEVMDVYLPQYAGQDKKFMMASHAERLQMSPCFLETHKTGTTHKPFTCTTCHNPHVSVGETQVEHFNNKCGSCHGGPDPCPAPPSHRMAVGNNCVSCHMPRSGTIDIPHVTITDHFIRKPGREATPSAEMPIASIRLKAMNNSTPEGISIARAWLYFFERFNHQGEFLDSAFRYLNKYPPVSHPADYIHYHFLKEDYRSVLGTAATASQLPPLALYQAGQSAYNLRQLDVAERYLAQACETMPFELDYRLRYGMVLLENRKTSGAKKQFDFVAKENHLLASPWNSLAFIALMEGNLSAADSLLKKALSLDPDYEPALVNKAKLLLAQDNIPAAKAVLANAAKRHPQSMAVRQLQQYIAGAAQ